MREPGPGRQRRRAVRLPTALSLLAVVVLIVVTGCARSVAGQPVGGTPKAPPPCTPTEPPATGPTAQSVPLIRFGWLSPWAPAWAQGDSVIIYTDRTAVGPPQKQPDNLRSTAPTAGTPAAGTIAPTGPTQDGGARVVPPVHGGWIDNCRLADLLDRAAAFASADLGKVTNVMDASSLSLEIAAHEGHPAASVSVYALGMGDENNSQLTSEQERAREQVSAWLKDTIGAIRDSAPMPVDRVLLYETRGAAFPSGSRDPRPVPWQGTAPNPQPLPYGSVRCQLLTGAAAAAAVANAERSSLANGSPKQRINGHWGVYTVAGSERNFALLARRTGAGLQLIGTAAAPAGDQGLTTGPNGWVTPGIPGRLVVLSVHAVRTTAVHDR